MDATLESAMSLYWLRSVEVAVGYQEKDIELLRQQAATFLNGQHVWGRRQGLHRQLCLLRSVAFESGILVLNPAINCGKGPREKR